MGGTPSPSPIDPTDQRLTRLEEHTAFAEHTVDQLSTEIAELNKRVHTLTTRVEGLEDRLRRLLEPPDQVPEEPTTGDP